MCNFFWITVQCQNAVFFCNQVAHNKIFRIFSNINLKKKSGWQPVITKYTTVCSKSFSICTRFIRLLLWYILPNNLDIQEKICLVTCLIHYEERKQKRSDRLKWINRIIWRSDQHYYLLMCSYLKKTSKISPFLSLLLN